MSDLVFKYRGLLWGIFGFAVLFFPVQFSVFRLLSALPLLLMGQLLRFWAAGLIPRYRTLTVAAPILVTSGPYAWIRNPLYAANGLMGCAWALMVGWWWVLAFLVVFSVMYLLLIIPHEERFLLAHFEDEYLRYKNTTPCIVPNSFCSRKRSMAGECGFDLRKSWLMERHSLAMNVVVSVLVFVRLYFA